MGQGELVCEGYRVGGVAVGAEKNVSASRRDDGAVFVLARARGKAVGRGVVGCGGVVGAPVRDGVSNGEHQTDGAANSRA